MPEEYSVAYDRLYGVIVATVYSDPYWPVTYAQRIMPYETSIFWKDNDRIITRYTTREEALQGHRRVVDELEKYMRERVVR